MKVRQLERLLVQHGAPASFLDTVTRVLRSESRLPLGGRGVNAPDIGPDEAAWVMVGLAATDVAAQAGYGFHRQLGLELYGNEQPRHAKHFVDAVQVILGSADWASEVAEVRVGRSYPLSQIIYADGHVERFTERGERAFGTASFRSEGVLAGGLLHQVAIDLSGENDLSGLGD